MRGAYLGAAATLCLLAACQPGPISQADEDAIRASTSAFAAAASAGNVDGMTAGYASDAVLQPPGQPAAVGTAAIHSAWAAISAPMTVQLTLTATKIAGQGDVAYAAGSYHIIFHMKDTTQASPPPEDGKWMNVFWRQSDKSWKIVAGSWNANTMPGAPAAPVPPPARGRRH
jgi:ketosteroid isomerase-like protein